MSEIELLKKQLVEARAENQSLTLRLSNVTLMLKKEMTESGKLPKAEHDKDGQVSPLVGEKILN